MSSVPPSQNQRRLPFPAIYLSPINDSWAPKYISLANVEHVKIGRQTNAKSIPGERNGFFDSKVLSRQHAEVWEEGGKIWIKDVKSSNGTYIDGNRLSPENMESQPFELKTNQVVEFGIDILSEDGQMVVHHKVAAHVVCVMSENDAARVAERLSPQGAPASFNFAPAGERRRPPEIAMGGMGGSMRVPGRAGLSFDHILGRLQGELVKSRETGAELRVLTGAMNDIHTSLGASVPPKPQPPSRSSTDPSSSSSSSITELQSQLRDTQVSLAEHIDKMRVLEGFLAEHEKMKQEVTSLREMMEERKQNEIRRQEADDDTSSIHTVVPHELEPVQEEEEEEEEEEQQHTREEERRDELGRPGTPEPTGMDDYKQRSTSPTAAIEDLATCVIKLSEQLDSAVAVSASLQAQHSATESALSALEFKLSDLTSKVEEAQRPSSPSPPPPSPPPSDDHALDRESLTQMLNEWKSSVEGQWSVVREEWNQERERLHQAREEWERKMKQVDAGLGTAVAKIDSGLASITAFHLSHTLRQHLPNGISTTGGGLVTPPSPRALSADSITRHHRRKRSGSRGRTRGPIMSSPELSPTLVTPALTDSLVVEPTGNGVPEQVKRAREPLVQEYGTISTAVGVLIISVAAAAVIWRIKPE